MDKVDGIILDKYKDLLTDCSLIVNMYYLIDLYVGDVPIISVQNIDVNNVTYAELESYFYKIKVLIKAFKNCNFGNVILLDKVYLGIDEFMKDRKIEKVR